MPHFFEYYVKGKHRYTDLDNRKFKPILKRIVDQACKVHGAKQGACIE